MNLLPNAVELIKRAALDAVDASKPVSVIFGQVISVSPLKIQVDQKTIYTEKMLILSRNVTDYTVMATGLESGYIVISNHLVIGDRVLLLRMQGGKRFVVLDRIK